MYYVVNVLVGLAVLADMLRRPQLEWALADRQRIWWIGILGFSTLFGLGPVVAVVYVLVVLPRFGGAGMPPLSPEFRK